MRKTRLIVGAAIVALVGLVATSALAGQGHARQPGVQVLDVDADLHWNGQLRLEAETSGASRVWITYSGKRYAARLVEVDREDRTREWARTVTAARADHAGNRTITVRVRACDGGGRCTVRSEREFLDREDD